MNNNSNLNAKFEQPQPARWIERHDLLVFFALTFLITFGGWIAAMLTGFLTLFDIGLWGPALAAIFITAVTRGKAGLKDLARRLLHIRVPVRWYLVILLGWPALSILAVIIYTLLTNQALHFEWNQWSGLATWLVSSAVLGFWACEEIGWRGFALPRLLNRWNALISSIILGVVWWLWHVPFYFANGTIHPDFYPFLILTVAVSILMTWIFNHTRGSIFVATFFHLWMNIYDGLQADKLVLASPGGETLIKYLLLAGAAILVVALYGHRSFTRESKQPASVKMKPFEA